ncbi:unnamed protein product, partial [Ectocarpus sp. 12 AP-2014]
MIHRAPSEIPPARVSLALRLHLAPKQNVAFVTNKRFSRKTHKNNSLRLMRGIVCRTLFLNRIARTHERKQSSWPPRSIFLSIQLHQFRIFNKKYTHIQHGDIYSKPLRYSRSARNTTQTK